MKFLRLLLFLATVFLFAGNDDVRKLYEAKEYQKCIEAAIASSAYSDAKVQWYWALSAEALGDNDSAVSAYERVLMLEPENKRAKDRLVALFEKMQMPKSAESVKKGVEDFDLLALEEKKKSLPLTARLLVRSGYDDNINYGSGDSESIINYNGATVNGDDPISTSFVQLQGNEPLANYQKQLTI